MKSKLIIICLLLAVFTQQYGQNKNDFSISLLNDEKVKLSEVYSNGPALVTFWALWCKPCLSEMKALNGLYEKYHSEGFSILAINQDTPRSSGKVKSFVKSNGLNFMIALDLEKEYSEMFNVQAIPLSLLFDRSGRIVYRHTGYLPGDEDELEKEIIKTLTEK